MKKKVICFLTWEIDFENQIQTLFDNLAVRLLAKYKYFLRLLAKTWTNFIFLP